MPDRPRFSRFRRLPGLYRFGDVKPPDPAEEPMLLALYLPAGLLDRAEALALRAGAESMHDFCADLLRQSIRAEELRGKAEAEEARLATLESLEEMANDPEYVAAVADLANGKAALSSRASLQEDIPLLSASDSRRLAVLAHAGLGRRDDPRGLLATLRRGEPVTEPLVDGLLAALLGLEDALREAPSLDRELAYALHRLAFEAQVLLGDEATAGAYDAGTVHRVVRVQEAVDRVLSGEDIRYYPTEGPRDEGAAP